VFDFIAGPDPLTSVSIEADETHTFSGVRRVTDYTIREAEQPNWTIEDIDCTVDDANGGSVTYTEDSAVISLGEGEEWSCTFTNSYKRPMGSGLYLSRLTSPVHFHAEGTVINYSYRLINSGDSDLGPDQFMVDDTMVDGGEPFACGAAGTTLEPGQSVSCAATYTTTLDDVDVGGVVSDAFGMGGGETTQTVQSTVLYEAKDEDEGSGMGREPGSITVVLDSADEDSTEFDVTAGPDPLGAFTLIDDGTDTDTRTFSSIRHFATYDIDMTIPEDWILEGVECVVVDPNTGTQSVDGSAVSIALTEGEDVTCTYSVARVMRMIGVGVTAAPGQFGGPDETITYSYVITNTGNVDLGPSQFSITDSRVAGGTAFDCGPADSVLAPAATLTCTGDGTTSTADDVTAGSITNTVTASDGELVSEPAGVTVPYVAPTTTTAAPTTTVAPTTTLAPTTTAAPATTATPTTVAAAAVTTAPAVATTAPAAVIGTAVTTTTAQVVTAAALPETGGESTLMATVAVLLLLSGSAGALVALRRRTDQR
jgi:LPXTG-motif cell wall-anchored protein